MHQLFGLVLGQRDLSRAGDLFSLEDAEIEDYLSEALEQIKAISCLPVSVYDTALRLLHTKGGFSHKIMQVMIFMSSYEPFHTFCCGGKKFNQTHLMPNS